MLFKLQQAALNLLVHAFVALAEGPLSGLEVLMRVDGKGAARGSAFYVTLPLMALLPARAARHDRPERDAVSR